MKNKNWCEINGSLMRIPMCKRTIKNGVKVYFTRDIFEHEAVDYPTITADRPRNGALILPENITAFSVWVKQPQILGLFFNKWIELKVNHIKYVPN